MSDIGPTYPLPASTQVTNPGWTLQPAASRSGSAISGIMTLSGDWTVEDGAMSPFPANGFAGIPRDGALVLHAEALGLWDSALISFLWGVKQRARAAGITVDASSLPDAAKRLLALLPEAPQPAAKPAPHRFAPFATVGAHTISALNEVGTMTELGAETARGGFRALAGRSGMRGRDLMANIADAGPSALVIVSIVNFLIGAILAFVGAVQLRKFAADAYVANLVGLACVRELSAVMTAIIMAGRTGGAYAARISTMLGNEEIDALRVFGIPVSTYILLPSILALMLMMPVLYLYGCLMSMFGGFVVTISMLNVTGVGYWHQTFGAVSLQQFEFGFVKSIVFAAMIGLTACRIGLSAGRSAADVGQAATRAVVVGIVGVIGLDAIFAVIANVIGI